MYAILMFILPVAETTSMFMLYVDLLKEISALLIAGKYLIVNSICCQENNMHIHLCYRHYTIIRSDRLGFPIILTGDNKLANSHAKMD